MGLRNCSVKITVTTFTVPFQLTINVNNVTQTIMVNAAGVVFNQSVGSKGSALHISLVANGATILTFDGPCETNTLTASGPGVLITVEVDP